ncbi:MAG: sugar-transfer associated ATP-grasp domain-containing protein [Eubacteriales bacterium]|nr:sugar-transfer associated ATP-grasp domain-containing protein [Eubacteriales bacterium]MDD3882472.1 sugar-transfer associated ATP-grasp domain-containing protein [Eubacteriales bacterium]MDD4513194.1 sugar-transfer associated ATP-grasp domain-containing protein [Eubacteriales bacterium]
MKLSYVAKRIVKMDYKRMWDTTKILKARSGKSRAWLLCDMLACAVKYNAGYMDYKIAAMYSLTDAQRRTVITRGISNEIVRRMNDKAYWHFFDDKTQFDKLFAAQVNREWMKIDDSTTAEQLESMLSKCEDIIAKPLEGSSGVGISKYHSADWAGKAAELLETLRKNETGIIEDVVKQHHLMSSLCPTSVNTIRIATLIGDKAEGIVYAFLRIGNGKVMDNVDCGGMAARVDLESGKLLTVGADKAGNTYEKHPMTGTPIIGFTIPYWEEAKKMALDAMKVVPQVRFVAWDIAITENGPVFIEGNSFPSHAIPQFAAHYPDGIGIMPEFRKFISNI